MHWKPVMVGLRLTLGMDLRRHSSLTINTRNGARKFHPLPRFAHPIFNGKLQRCRSLIRDSWTNGFTKTDLKNSIIVRPLERLPIIAFDCEDLHIRSIQSQGLRPLT